MLIPLKSNPCKAKCVNVKEEYCKCTGTVARMPSISLITMARCQKNKTKQTKLSLSIYAYKSELWSANAQNVSFFKYFPCWSSPFKKILSSMPKIFFKCAYPWYYQSGIND